MGRTIERTCLKGVLIASDDCLEPVNPRIEDVTIKSKTVRSPRAIWGNRTTEAIDSYLFVRIVVLKNLADTADGLQILVAIRVEVV